MFIKKHLSDTFTKNIFMKNVEFKGVDNIYMGNINTMYRIVHHFHHNLDNILNRSNGIIHQEYLVFRENNILCYN
jgi:hypothetical protein